MALFVVMNTQGPNWDPSRPMREQAGWSDHAHFMNALVDEGLVVLGGPIGVGPAHRAMLVLRAPEEGALRRRLLEDPWMRAGILRLGELERWEILLGQLA